MTDAFRTWLEQMVAYYTDMCEQSAAQRGYPGKIRFAEQSYRENLEAYEDCLYKYDEFLKTGAVSHNPLEVLAADARAEHEAGETERGGFGKDV